MSVVVETTLGDFTIDLYVKERPRTSMNFLKLCKMKFYNFQLFFKVTPNFACQAGDPTRSGRGGESIFRHLYGNQARFFEAEKIPRLKHLKIGTVSMVDNGDGMLGSQFLITLSDNLEYLDEQHCVFGEVVEGMEFLEKINEVICDKDERPLQDIMITHTVVLEDPFEEPDSLTYPPSPEVTLERLKSDRIGCYEDIDDYEGKTVEEIQEAVKDKQAKAEATLLEIIGDLPDADMAPPENVLFICKLNPVTNDDDLELIFSRFGEIKSCEVIRDWKSGESLQYAFIEFAETESCERAYFKMDNVIIDDRRIHVDFSQSVAKVKWKGKGRGVVGSWSEDDKRNTFADKSRGRGAGRWSENEKRKKFDDRTRTDRPRDGDRHRSEADRSESERRKRSEDTSRSRNAVDNWSEYERRKKSEHKSTSRDADRSRSESDLRRRSDDKSRRSRDAEGSRSESERRKMSEEKSRSRGAVDSRSEYEWRKKSEHKSASRDADRSRSENERRRRSDDKSRRSHHAEGSRSEIEKRKKVDDEPRDKYERRKTHRS